MIDCESCGTAFDDSAIACPFCRAPRGIGGLSRASQYDGLARVQTEDLLARTDAHFEDLLARDVAGPLSPGDLRDALVRVDARTDPSVADLENALATEAMVALDGITLASLVEAGSDDVKILKRGLAFLKNRKYREALEWWSLHREALDPSRERMQLLLLLMEAFTYRLAGDARRAEDVHARVTAHPIFRKLRGLERK
ncbi:MAG TPA: hypothetical protein VGM88_00745 [Kofleriaceae bacterium]